MSKFLSDAQLEPMWTNDKVPMPLFNRDGRRLYLVLSDLNYQSDIAKQIITAPKGFISDLGSVPRIPLVFDALGEIAIEPYLIHDVLYNKKTLSRALADNILLEALKLVGISYLKRMAIYQGVHLFGGSHWGS